MLEMPTHINVTPAFHRHQLMVLGRYRGIIHVPTGFKLVLLMTYAFMLSYAYSYMCMPISYVYMYAMSTHALRLLILYPFWLRSDSGDMGWP
jgi:hypothetical protein